MIASTPLFDTHSHLADDSLSCQLDSVILRATEAGIVGIVAIGTTLENSRKCVEIAAKHERVWAAVGIHPNYCAEVNPSDWEQIEQLSRSPKVVAIGETGLDRHWDHTPWSVQMDYFRRHIELSVETELPLVIHMRDCEDEMLAALTDLAAGQTLRGIMHSFTGTVDGALASMDRGLHISFAGMVTYPKSHALRGVAAQIPANRLLLETDSPYLSPHPKRGQRPNEPELIIHTARCVAECRNVTLAQLAAETTENARRLFAVK